MIHLMDIDELDRHINDESCSCNPRIIFDKVTNELVALHPRIDKSLLTDEEAIELLREDEATNEEE